MSSKAYVYSGRSNAVSVDQYSGVRPEPPSQIGEEAITLRLTAGPLGSFDPCPPARLKQLANHLLIFTNRSRSGAGSSPVVSKLGCKVRVEAAELIRPHLTCITSVLSVTQRDDDHTRTIVRRDPARSIDIYILTHYRTASKCLPSSAQLSSSASPPSSSPCSPPSRPS